MPSRSTVRPLVRYGWTIAGLNGAGVLHRTMDRLIVGAVLGAPAVGLVEIATQVQNGGAAVLAASSYTAVAASSWLDARRDVSKTRELLLVCTRYSLLVTEPVIVLIAVLAPRLVRLWVGPSHQAAAGLAIVAVAHLALTAPQQVGANMMQGSGRAGVVLRPALVGVALNLGLSVLLVHLSGIVGVFEDTIISTAMVSPWIMRSIVRVTGTTIRELLRESVLPGVLPAFGAGAAAATVSYAIGSDAIAAVCGLAAGGAAVLATLPLALTAHERAAVQRRLHRAQPAPAPR